MSVRGVPFNRPSPVGREVEYIQEAIASGHLAGDGRFTKLCNAEIARLTGARGALLTHSATAALEMAAILCDLRPGDEVVMPSFTFVSTANAVALRGAVPVFVDIDPGTLNIDPAAAAAAVTGRTKAIFAVHYAGFPADMDRLAATARAHGLLLVEDAAQALGASYKGRPAGSLGDMAAFSFHETKNIVSGEGGALTLMRDDLLERAEIIREKGTNRSRFFRGQVDKYTWVDIGSSYLPGELIAAFLAAQLEKADEIRRRRLDQYRRYRAAFADLAAEGRLVLPREPADTVGNGHMFYLLLRDIDDRDGFIAEMKAAGITCPFHYVPLHSAPAGRLYGRTDGDLPVTDDISARLVRLPMYYDLGEDIDRVIDTARRALSGPDRREGRVGGAPVGADPQPERAGGVLEIAR
jgi:dTDP-4-amino-4,6-dideoxygalactose transaminase